jgi:hypothetical protein
VATANHEIFIFIPLDENKSCIYRKNLYILYIYLFFDLPQPGRHLSDERHVNEASSSPPIVAEGLLSPSSKNLVPFCVSLSILLLASLRVLT